MVSVLGGSQMFFQNPACLMIFFPKLQNCDNFALFDDILASPNFSYLIKFARKLHKTAVASALNSNNNNKSQRQQ